MTKLMQAIRSGDWLTQDRIQVYSAMVLVMSIVALGWLVATADGIVDYQRRPLGTDYSNVYAAGKWVLAGRPQAPFSPALQHEMEKRVFGADTPFYGWVYPPFFLAVAALLALMPYLWSLALWQAATLVPYLAVVRAIVARTFLSPSPLWGEGRGEGGSAAVSDSVPPHPTALRAVDLSPKGRGEGGIGATLWLLPALGFPAVYVNLGHGHNGFLTASLIGGGLILIDRRPVLAGILFGLLAYKPHFGLLIPLVLAVSGRWRVFAAATATVAVLSALTLVAFGSATWLAFRDSFEFTRTVVLELGATGFHKIQSPFAAVRLWGAPVPLAYGVQAAATLAVMVLLARLWRSEAVFALKAAALLAGALISTPYLLDYDLVVMAPAIAFLAAHGLARGFLPYEKSALAFAWIAPLVTRALAEYLLLPLGLIALVVLFTIALRRAAADLGSSWSLSPFRLIK